MAIMSTRPGVKVKVGVKYPSRIEAATPLSATLSGGVWRLSFDSTSVLAGTCWLWQIKYGLLDYGIFSTVEAGIPAATATRLNVMWTNGARSEVGDTLSNFIRDSMGWNDAQIAAFYAYCAEIIL